MLTRRTQNVLKYWRRDRADPFPSIQLKFFLDRFPPLLAFLSPFFLPGLRPYSTDWMHGWMDGWTDGRTDGRTDGWMDGWMDLSRLNVCHPDFLDLDRCLFILFWLYACK